MVRVAGPARASICLRTPTATMRPPRTATESASVERPVIVSTVAPLMTSSANSIPRCYPYRQTTHPRGAPARIHLAAGPASAITSAAIATILALVPLAAGFNEGSIIAAELGTVVIGGLLSSTFLTLILVPVVSSRGDGAKARLRQRPSGMEAAVTN